MGYRDHIVAKLSALAVAGGTTAMLFAATPVHTQFSATTNGSLSASGANVSEVLTNGTLTATGLVPPTSSSAVTAESLLTSPPSTLNATGWNWTTPTVNVYVKNSGTVSEAFTLNISSVDDAVFANNQSALEQLWVAYTPSGGSTFYYQVFPSTNVSGGITGSGSSHDTAPFRLTDPVNLTLGTIPAGTTKYATVAFALAPYVSGSGEGGANAWNDANIYIPYTITAEPSTTPTPGPSLTATGSVHSTP